MEIMATDRRGKLWRHTASDRLTDAEVLDRFGLRGRPFNVDVYPAGRPDKTRRIQESYSGPEGNRVTPHK